MDSNYKSKQKETNDTKEDHAKAQSVTNRVISLSNANCNEEEEEEDVIVE